MGLTPNRLRLQCRETCAFLLDSPLTPPPQPPLENMGLTAKGRVQCRCYFICFPFPLPPSPPKKKLFSSLPPPSQKRGLTKQVGTRHVPALRFFFGAPGAVGAQHFLALGQLELAEVAELQASGELPPRTSESAHAMSLCPKPEITC